MPTQQTTYNSRITDEALEKRFRDTFRSQGGAELVDDLYASGVIVPVVDFTAAAEGSSLPFSLQTASDFSTGVSLTINGTNSLVSTPGFWQLGMTVTGLEVSTSGPFSVFLEINDGSTSKQIWGRTSKAVGTGTQSEGITESHLVVFLRTGDTLRVRHTTNNAFTADIWYRQIADVYGNLIDPTGFTSQ